MARIPHKVHLPRNPSPIEISPEYQNEVDRSTDKLQRRYERVKKAADAARFRRDRAALIVGNNKLRAQRLADAQAALIARLDELAELERLMQENPYASLTHRGREGWTKVPR